MADVKSYQAFTRLSNYRSLAMDEPRPLGEAERNKKKEIATPCCLVLQPTEAVDANAAGTALLTARVEEIPRRNAYAVVAVELPHPSAFGEFDLYEAVLFEPGVASFVATLAQTPTHAWAGALGGISLPFSPSMRVIVRPASSESGASGPVVLTGSASNCLR